MSEELGPLTFGHRHDQVFLGRDLARDRNYSEAVAFSIDREARRIMDECYNRAKQILEEHMDKLHLVAQTLMEKETLEAEEFEALIETSSLPEKAERAGEPAAFAPAPVALGSREEARHFLKLRFSYMPGLDYA
jgi:cell division protease FtsH